MSGFEIPTKAEAPVPSDGSEGARNAFFEQVAQVSGSPTDQPLSPRDNDLVNEIVRNVHSFDAGKDDAWMESLSKALTCVSRERLERLLPAINKDLEPLGLYFGKFPGRDEITVSKTNLATGELGNFAQLRLPGTVECRTPMS